MGFCLLIYLSINHFRFIKKNPKIQHRYILTDIKQQNNKKMAIQNAFMGHTVMVDDMPLTHMHGCGGKANIV